MVWGEEGGRGVGWGMGTVGLGWVMGCGMKWMGWMGAMG